MDKQSKWWDSFTNIMAFMLVVAMIFFTYKGILPIEIFSGAVTLVLGAYFQKSGQKDGQQAAQSVTAQIVEPTPPPSVGGIYENLKG